MGTSKLFSSGVMNAKTVATIGYEKMIKNTMTIIPGLRNKVLAFASNTMLTKEMLVAILNRITKTE